MRLLWLERRVAHNGQWAKYSKSHPQAEDCRFIILSLSRWKSPFESILVKRSARLLFVFT